MIYFLKKCKEKWFKKMSHKEYSSGLVSTTILPNYKEHDFNLETKAINLYFYLLMLHTNFFKCGKNMPLVYINDENNLVEDYIDLSEFIDNPEKGWKELGNPYNQKEYHKNKCDKDELESFEEEWKEYWDDCGWSNTEENIKKWNEKIVRGMLIQEEYKQLIRLIYKNSYKKAKKVISQFNYEDDVSAHASFGGRWRSDRKDKINKIRNYSLQKKG